MSTAGVLWVLLCAFFAIMWITVGWFLLPIFNVFFFFGSLLVMIPAFMLRQRR